MNAVCFVCLLIVLLKLTEKKDETLTGVINVSYSCC